MPTRLKHHTKQKFNYDQQLKRESAYSTLPRNRNRINRKHLEICLSSSQKNRNSFVWVLPTLSVCPTPGYADGRNTAERMHMQGVASLAVARARWALLEPENLQHVQGLAESTGNSRQGSKATKPFELSSRGGALQQYSSELNV